MHTMSWGVRAVGMAGLALVILWGASVRAEVVSITEIFPVSNGFSEPYIELTFFEPARPVDVAVINAFDGSDFPVLSFFSIDPGSAHMVLIHQGEWRPEQPLAPSITHAVSSPDLKLGETASGAARWIVVFEPFDPVDRWAFGHLAPHPSAWADDPAVPTVLDMVTYDLNDPAASWQWPAVHVGDGPLLNMAFGDAAWRVLIDANPSDVFRVGPVDDEGAIADPTAPVRLDPAVMNISQPHAPEPSSAMLMLLSGAALLNRKRRAA